ncbi:MAG TPA: polysaccharide deacetylase family protein, partial [Pirellulales bacterium]|nr:polysaccharide deacetylase family protein [Pirellulales bacterium]
EAGYQGVVSAYGGYNFAGDDPFHLQRMGVDGPMIRLKNLTTLDPFKQWNIPRYDYQEIEQPFVAGSVVEE